MVENLMKNAAEGIGILNGEDGAVGELGEFVFADQVPNLIAESLIGLHIDKNCGTERIIDQIEVDVWLHQRLSQQVKTMGNAGAKQENITSLTKMGFSVVFQIHGTAFDADQFVVQNDAGFQISAVSWHDVIPAAAEIGVE